MPLHIQFPGESAHWLGPDSGLSTSIFLYSIGNLPYETTVGTMMPQTSFTDADTEGMYAFTCTRNVIIGLTEELTEIVKVSDGAIK